MAGKRSRRSGRRRTGDGANAICTDGGAEAVRTGDGAGTARTGGGAVTARTGGDAVTARTAGCAYDEGRTPGRGAAFMRAGVRRRSA
ncbi:hypothetical protein AB0I22_21595 [Streptomyces sp. NPDC050610]|uniref:hypothetical protein n=1 Tax=Streptomyces sp. NPDC050610 TaxID=3157097 RepID=UPI003423EE0F